MYTNYTQKLVYKWFNKREKIKNGNYHCIFYTLIVIDIQYNNWCTILCVQFVHMILFNYYKSV